MLFRSVLLLVLLSVAAQARATWSVVAVDPVTREVGVAVATCIAEPNGSRLLPMVAGLAPGIGALAAQAQLNQQTRDHALSLLRAQLSPAAIIAQVNASDLGAANRQYGIVTFDAVASYTGPSCLAWAGAQQGENVSVQGNILVAPEVVADALRAFAASAPCEDSLADKLLRALAAGVGPGGDRRCPADQGAYVAVLRVAGAHEDGDRPSLDLTVTAPRGRESPVTLLQRAYETYRERHPADLSACRGGSDAAVPEDTMADDAAAAFGSDAGALDADGAADGSRDASADENAPPARDASRPRAGPSSPDGGPRGESEGEEREEEEERQEDDAPALGEDESAADDEEGTESTQAGHAGAGCALAGPAGSPRSPLVLFAAAALVLGRRRARPRTSRMSRAGQGEPR